MSERHNASIFRVEEKAKQDSISVLAYSSTLKMEAVCSSKILVNFYKAKQVCIS
jgi:hypothetical protein